MGSQPPSAKQSALVSTHSGQRPHLTYSVQCSSQSRLGLLTATMLAQVEPPTARRSWGPGERTERASAAGGDTARRTVTRSSPASLLCTNSLLGRWEGGSIRRYSSPS